VDDSINLISNDNLDLFFVIADKDDWSEALGQSLKGQSCGGSKGNEPRDGRIFGNEIAFELLNDDLPLLCFCDDLP